MKINPNIEKQLFTIPLYDNLLESTKEITGELVSLKEMPSEFFFVHYNSEFGDWCLCEMQFGVLLIRGGLSRQDIIEKGELILRKHKARFQQIKQDWIEKFEIILPLNEFA